MKIKSIDLERVRQFKRLKLGFDKPLTVITGPNGAGKTTLQRAILTAMFQVSDKGDRDALQSVYEIGKGPTATLELTGTGGSKATLVRSLLDYAGSWAEGGQIVHGKHAALKKVQDLLPISSAAAGLLLAGSQRDLDAIVEAKGFPSDGHSILTQAIIRGRGPDPKVVLEALRKAYAAAKVGGEKTPGALTQAERRVKALGEQLEAAEEANRELEKLNGGYRQAVADLEQARQEWQAARDACKHLDAMEILLRDAVAAGVRVEQLQKQEEQWKGIDDAIAADEAALEAQRQQLEELGARLRVARGREIAQAIDAVDTRLKAIEAAQQAVAKVEEAIKSAKRPSGREETALEELSGTISKLAAKIEATGVRYEVSAQQAVKVEVSEDGEAPKAFSLTTGAPQANVVGRVTIQAAGITFSAAGKEDVSSLRRQQEQAQAKRQELLKRFGVKDVEAFFELVKEREELDQELKSAKAALAGTLGRETCELVIAQRQKLVQEQADNAVTGEEQARFRGIPLEAAATIQGEHVQVQRAIARESAKLSEQKRTRPTEAQRQKLAADLKQALVDKSTLEARFEAADERKRTPSEALLKQIRQELPDAREMVEERQERVRDYEKTVTGLKHELQHAGAATPPEAIESDLEDANRELHRQEVLQEGRKLMGERLNETIEQLTQDVPRNLEEKVAKYLSQLSGGAYGQAELGSDLSIARVHETGENARGWDCMSLSHGERHQVALAIKIATAQALADWGGSSLLILDDSLVSLDDERTEAAQKCLAELVANGKLQVILLTCHEKWAEGFAKANPEQVQLIRLKETAEYYRGGRKAEAAMAVTPA